METFTDEFLTALQVYAGDQIYLLSILFHNKKVKSDQIEYLNKAFSDIELTSDSYSNSVVLHGYKEHRAYIYLVREAFEDGDTLRGAFIMNYVLFKFPNSEYFSQYSEFNNNIRSVIIAFLAEFMENYMNEDIENFNVNRTLYDYIEMYPLVIGYIDNDTEYQFWVKEDDRILNPRNEPIIYYDDPLQENVDSLQDQLMQQEQDLLMMLNRDI